MLRVFDHYLEEELFKQKRRDTREICSCECWTKSKPAPAGAEKNSVDQHREEQLSGRNL